MRHAGLTGVHSKGHFARKRPLKGHVGALGARCASQRWVSGAVTCASYNLIAAPVTPRRGGGYSSCRRPSRRPFRGMDLAGKIPPGRERWPSIALTTNSCSLKRPVGSSRTMHRHRHRCWSARSRPARAAQERLFAWLPPQESNAWRADIFQADCTAPR